MMAVSKVWRRSFGSFRLTLPALVCSDRPQWPARVSLLAWLRW